MSDSPYVSTAWLAEHLNDPDLVVVDASVVPFVQPDGRSGYLTGHELYLVEGHIPGAVFADLLDEFSDAAAALPFTRPSAEQFAAAASALGIGPTSTVVVYDSQVGQFASRLWWLLRAFGHKRAFVLSGGLTAWRNEERPLDTGHVLPVPAAFVAVEHPEYGATKADVEAVLEGDRDAALVCALPRKDYSGELSPRPRAGHIPGSVNIPAAEIVDRATREVRPTAELAELAGDVVDADEVIVYCAAGIAVTSAAIALVALGARKVSVFDGSLNEWIQDPAAPLAFAS